jgi:hypothetical protein
MLNISAIKKATFVLFVLTAVAGMHARVLAGSAWTGLSSTIATTCTQGGVGGQDLEFDASCYCEDSPSCDEYAMGGQFCSEFWAACSDYCVNEWGTDINYPQGAHCDDGGPYGAYGECMCLPH